MAMKMTLLAAFAALLSLHAAPALAENSEVNLTRKGSNVYKIDGKDIIIQTRYCYVYAYSEEAIFKTSGYGGEVIFFDSKEKCNVKAVFGVSKQKPGTYVVTVSRVSATSTENASAMNSATRCRLRPPSLITDVGLFRSALPILRALDGLVLFLGHPIDTLLQSRNRRRQSPDLRKRRRQPIIGFHDRYQRHILPMSFIGLCRQLIQLIPQLRARLTRSGLAF
jgi:hypothetical protein